VCLRSPRAPANCAEPAGNTRCEFAASWRNDLVKWRKVIIDSRITATSRNMTAKPAKSQPVSARHQRNKKHPALPASNAALNQQNRRVLAQHYRAKYGVK
jgi:hypothetical protein